VPFFAFQQGSGVYVLLFYSMDVLRDCGVRWDGTTMLLSVALCFSLLHRVKRRALLAVSLLVVVAAHVEWSDGRPPYPAILIVPFAGFVFFGLIGVLPIPWILSGEIFPTPVSVQNNCSPTPLRFRNEFHETVPVLYDETAQLYSVVLMRVVMQGGK